MNLDDNQLDYFKSVAQELSTVLISEDYGDDGIEKLTFLTDAIKNIYKHLNFQSFQQIVIYTFLSKDQSLSLENIEDVDHTVYRSFQNLSQIQGSKLTIEVSGNLELLVSIDFVPDLDELRNHGIVYIRENEVETFLGKTEQRRLKEIPISESYFSVPTFRKLDEALEDYKVKIARYSSNCPHLSTVWFDTDKIFFKPSPEQIMRNSLTYFLQIRLRGTEVRPEQVVDQSHPVDIKVTWNLSSKLALIEIKWLGKSISKLGESFSQTYTASRAVNGAKQLIDYLDANKIQAPDKTTKGYLAVFDGRRWSTNTNTTEISKEHGFYYQNSDITYTPEYHTIRIDFSKPVRFFMEPNCKA